MKKILLTILLFAPLAAMAQLGDAHVDAGSYSFNKADEYYRKEKQIEGKNTFFEEKQYDRLILEGDDFMKHNQYKQAKASYSDARALLVNNIQLPDTERLERLDKKILLCDQQIAKGLDADDAKAKAKAERKAFKKAKAERKSAMKMKRKAEK